MRRALLSLFAVFVSLAMYAEYGFMTFVTSSGATTLPVDGMTMIVDGADLKVSYNGGNTSFTLSGLVEMYFSDEQGTTALREAVIDANAPISAFTVLGVHVGDYTNFNEAVQNLVKGSYVIRQKSNSQKIVLK